MGSFARVLGAGMILLGCIASEAFAKEAEPLWKHLPETISPEWGDFFAARGKAREQAVPAPDDIAGWRAVRAGAKAPLAAQAKAYAEAMNMTLRDRIVGGVPVVEIIPAEPMSDQKVAVYIHGGAYVLGTAGTLQAVLFAAATGLRVISIDYTLAPQSMWQNTTAEVLAVFSALAEEGITAGDTVLGGDSAGGGLAAGSVLRMRDEGMDLPAALILWSPWSDISETGDSYVTLRDAESVYTYKNILGPSAIAYADPKDHHHPYVSPVYGDFAAGYPPTLIQGGIRELFLSNSVRLYQALDQAGQTVKLDLYEGMPHVFMAQMPETAESKIAFKKAGDWVSEHLLKDEN